MLSLDANNRIYPGASQPLPVNVKKNIDDQLGKVNGLPNATEAVDKAVSIDCHLSYFRPIIEAR